MCILSKMDYGCTPLPICWPLCKSGGKIMKQSTIQEIYAVRLFMFGNIFEVKTFNSYNYALDWAMANLQNSDWDIKKVRQ